MVYVTRLVRKEPDTSKGCVFPNAVGRCGAACVKEGESFCSAHNTKAHRAQYEDFRHYLEEKYTRAQALEHAGILDVETL